MDDRFPCRPIAHDALRALTRSADDGDTLNILLVGGMDGRHVLKTLSRLHRHADSLAGLAGDGDKPQRPKPRVRLFVAETVMELVARQLLFILAALEPPDHLGRTEKVGPGRIRCHFRKAQLPESTATLPESTAVPVLMFTTLISPHFAEIALLPVLVLAILPATSG